MKVLWALVASIESLVKMLNEIRGQLVQINQHLQKKEPDLTKMPGESDGDYYSRLRKYETRGT
jgi:hypothetical protein